MALKLKKHSEYVGLSTDDKTTLSGEEGAIVYYTDTKKKQINHDGIWTDLPDEITEFEISVEITRPSNTTSYAANQIINGNGSTTLPSLDFSVLGNLAGRRIQFNNINILSSNGGATTKLSAIAHLFNSNTITAQSLTDGTAFNPSYSELKAKRATTFDDISTSVVHGSNAALYMQTDLIRNATLDANSKLYVALITNNAYTPASGETITISVKGYLLN